MKVAMIVPARERCGINDYSRMIRDAFPHAMDLVTDLKFNGTPYDIIHVQYEPTLFRQGRKNLLSALFDKHHKPKVVTVHEIYESNPFIAPPPVSKGFVGMLKKFKYNYMHRLEIREEGFARLGFFADGIIVHSRQAADILQHKGCAMQKVAVVPMPVISAQQEEAVSGGKRPVPDNKKIILMFGFITQVNDYAAVLHAFSRFADRATLVIAGPPRRQEDKIVEKNLDNMVRELNLAPHVKRLGFVEEGTLQSIFRTADIFIAPAIIKTGSTTLARALGAHLPAIAVDLPYVRQINDEVACVRTYPAGDAEKLAQHISILLNDQENINARNRVRQYAMHHTLEQFVHKHLEIYRRVLENSH